MEMFRLFLSLSLSSLSSSTVILFVKGTVRNFVPWREG